MGQTAACGCCFLIYLLVGINRKIFNIVVVVVECCGVVGVYWLVLVGGSGELVSLLLDVCWDRIVGRGKVSH